MLGRKSAIVKGLVVVIVGVHVMIAWLRVQGIGVVIGVIIEGQNGQIIVDIIVEHIVRIEGIILYIQK